MPPVIIFCWLPELDDPADLHYLHVVGPSSHLLRRQHRPLRTLNRKVLKNTEKRVRKAGISRGCKELQPTWFGALP